MIFSGRNTGRKLTNSGGITRQSPSFETKLSSKRRTVKGRLQGDRVCGESSLPIKVVVNMDCLVLLKV